MVVVVRVALVPQARHLALETVVLVLQAISRVLPTITAVVAVAVRALPIEVLVHLQHIQRVQVVSAAVAMEPTQQQQQAMVQPTPAAAAVVQATPLIQPLDWVAQVVAVLWSLHSLKERSPSMRAQVRSLSLQPAGSQA